MSEELKTIITETQANFRANPDQALATFEVQTSLGEGLHSKATVRDFAPLDIDEPPVLGGTDQGPNPVEVILAALGSCQEITYRAYAAALDIPLEGVSVKLEGDLDLRGFLAVDDSVRPGYLGVRANITLNSSASEEQISNLVAAVNAHCPVLDILKNPTPVEINVTNIAAATKAAE